MRIVVNDIAASADSGGAFSVLNDFYNDIVKNGGNHEWILLLNEKHFQEHENIIIKTYPEIKKSWLKRILFDVFQGKKIINDLNPDIYLSLQNTSTLGVKSTQYVYLHQPLPYQEEKNFSFLKKREFKYAVYQKVIGFIFNFLFKVTKSNIIVQTEWMKRNVNKKVKNKIYISKPILQQENLKKQFVSPNFHHFFFPASNLVYKNHQLIFDALKYIQDPKIRIYLTIDKNELIETSIDNRVVFLGKINRERVFELYKKTVLLFPSYIESFGYPLLEARLLKTFILASDTDFSREILKGYSNILYFDKDDPKYLANLMSSLMKYGYYSENDSDSMEYYNNTSILNIIIKN
ncbi:glycosyltransferase [Enterococcus mundtii]|uniref:glycosyltransferase n=1 Tax=Enterococcus mundtii TaxID=53346 RepID=UPI00189A7EB9|nr:glycosyltransferase [Enterococcus mundtii]MDB7100866.1 glycosyltransferase [Enterococcus mundtii]